MEGSNNNLRDGLDTMAPEKSCRWLDRNPGENKGSVREHDELSFGNVGCKCVSVKAQWKTKKPFQVF